MTLWRRGEAVAPDSRKASWAESDSRTRKIFQRNCPLQSAVRYESTREPTSGNKTPRVSEDREPAQRVRASPYYFGLNRISSARSRGARHALRDLAQWSRPLGE